MRMWMMLSAVLLLATGALFAQGFGGMSEAIMLNTPKGLFALKAGVLVKYNLAPLKQVQQQNLFGALPTRPGQDAGQDAWQKYSTDMQKRNAPAVMIAKDNSLLLVIGDVFARYNMDTLAPEASGSLRSPTAPAADDGGRGFRMQEPAPGYLLVANTLYLMRSREMVAVNIVDGKVLDRTDLPEEMQPQQMFGGNRFNFGGGGNRGGGGGGGGRGN